MNEKDWEQFADLLQKIVALPGTWNAKKNLLSSKLDEFGAKDDFAEIVSWYDGGEIEDDEDWDDDDEEDWGDDDDMDGE